MAQTELVRSSDGSFGFGSDTAMVSSTHATDATDATVLFSSLRAPRPPSDLSDNASQMHAWSATPGRRRPGGKLLWAFSPASSADTDFDSPGLTCCQPRLQSRIKLL